MLSAFHVWKTLKLQRNKEIQQKSFKIREMLHFCMQRLYNLLWRKTMTLFHYRKCKGGILNLWQLVFLVIWYPFDLFPILLKMFYIMFCIYLIIWRILLVCKLICVTWYSCQPLTHFASITNTANANKGCFDEATCISSKSHKEFDGTMQCKIGHSLS